MIASSTILHLLVANSLFYQIFANGRCLTSTEADSSRKGVSCVFPFSLRGKIYSSCTYDYSHITKYKPWCSTKVDQNGNHISAGGNWGICADSINCPIPPKYCGIPVSTRRLPTNRELDVNIEQQPWMVTLGWYREKKWKHTCGGSLITSKNVLTAAHCFNPVKNDRNKFEKYRMRLGISDYATKTKYELDLKVIQIFTHPKYKYLEAYFDAGIAVAERHIEFNDFIRPVCLPFRPVEDEDAMAEGSRCKNFGPTAVTCSRSFKSCSV